MSTYTVVHVILSLIGIGSGFIVLYGLLTASRMNGMTLVFLATTIATSATGFGFPFNGFTPAIGVGILSVIVLAAAVAARYVSHLQGAWRPIYVIGAVTALYFNVFVLVAQAFLKVPALQALAPTGSEPAFLISQGVVLVLFLVMGRLSVKRFHPASVQAA
jgi:hypothetical protein